MDWGEKICYKEIEGFRKIIMLIYKVKILKINSLNANIKSFLVEKPLRYRFIPGQAVDFAIDLPEWKDQIRPFSIASLNSEANLEFIIKIYRDIIGVTKKLDELKSGEKLLISDAFGEIKYKGPGIFIAGGTGITPFIAILRQLKKDSELKSNSLIFSNKTEKDIFLKSEIDEMSKEGLNVLYTLTRETNLSKQQILMYENKRIDELFLKEKIKDFKQYFYVCGPIRFVGEISYILGKLGADPDKIVVES